ncbi:MAG: 2Fe-2S iron-sulfur cluster-binding protein [Limnochordales bacterium]
MTPAAAEMLLIGILAGFFISAVVQQLTSRRGATLDEQTMAELEKVVEEALARKIAAGGFVAAAPGVAAAAPAAAPAAAEAEAADGAPAEADAAVATAEAPAGAAPAGEPVPLIVTTMDGTRHELQVGAGENLLDAALERNVDLDYSCKEGSCDTCTVRILKGMENLSPVREEERDMLGDDLIKEGHRLACIISIHGPVELVQEQR